MGVIEQIRVFITHHQINGKVVVGVSGGVDSMVLLYTLKQCGLEPIAAHVNYKTRGADSDADQEMVSHWCREHNVIYEVTTADYKNATGNFQNWARDKRYTYFHRLRSDYEARWIATAHHKDDQVETILQRILRGASPISWQGMAAVDEPLFRPLLDIPKTDIIRLAKEKDIPWREDASNQEIGYARNFIRHELKPDLDNFFPGWEENILCLRESGESYGWMLNEVMKKHVRGASVDRAWLMSVPLAIRRSVLVDMIRRDFPEYSANVTRNNLLVSDRLEELQTGRKIQLTSSLFIMADRDVFTIQKEKTHSPNQNITIDLENLSTPVQFDEFRLRRGIFKEVIPEALELNKDFLGKSITIRQWQNGDRIEPLGLAGSQKVSDVLTNKKISASQKDASLVVVSFDGIISAIIFPPSQKHTFPGVISEKAKCRPGDPTVIIEKCET